MDDDKKKNDHSYIMEFADEPVGIRIDAEDEQPNGQPVAPRRSQRHSGKPVSGRSATSRSMPNRYTSAKQAKKSAEARKTRPPSAGLYINLQRVVKCVLFFMVFFFLLTSISDVLARKSLTEPWNMTVKVGGFYNEPADSIEVMFFGSSHMYCSVDPVQLEELTGRICYTMATQEQPVWVSYYYMKEALKTQSPNTIFFEVNMLVAEEEFAEEGTLYSAFDPIPLSMNKISMVNASVPWGEKRYYMFNIMKYHERWMELDLEKDIIREFADELDPYRGYVRLPAAVLVEEREDVAAVTEVGTPLEKSLEYLEKIIALSKKEGFQLVLMKSPSNASAEEQALYNAAWQIAQREGVPYIDGNLLYEELGLDLETDFFDPRHLNYSGAEKFTLYLGEYLK